MPSFWEPWDLLDAGRFYPRTGDPTPGARKAERQGGRRQKGRKAYKESRKFGK
jgi:hypothetical protein